MKGEIYLAIEPRNTCTGIFVFSMTGRGTKKRNERFNPIGEWFLNSYQVFPYVSAPCQTVDYTELQQKSLLVLFET